MSSARSESIDDVLRIEGEEGDEEEEDDDDNEEEEEDNDDDEEDANDRMMKRGKNVAAFVSLAGGENFGAEACWLLDHHFCWK